MSITQFTGEYEFLSNFYNHPIKFNGLKFQNAEAAYEAQRTDDINVRKRFCRLSGNKAKALGRRVEEREMWNYEKEEVMRQIIREKFKAHTELAQKLIDTGDEELINVNTWRDSYWGISNGSGKNKLGRILMQIRSELSA